MSEKKLMTYEGLEEYNIKWHERLQAMTISDADIDAIAFKALGVDALEIPDEWTVSSDGTLNLAASNAYSYWPEGAGTKNIVISNPSARNSFWLKLTDGGNFILNWDSNIQWTSETEPIFQSFTEDIFYFYRNEIAWTGILVSTKNITPYWKYTINAIRRTDVDNWYSLGDYGHTAFVPFCGFDNGATIDWGDGTIETYTMTDLLLNSSNIYANRSQGFPQHTYQTDGNYQIKIEYDDFENIYIYNYISSDNTDIYAAAYVENIVSIDSPVPKIKGSWIDCSTSIHTENDSFQDIFCGYENLISIPEKLFYNNPNITSLSCAFDLTPLENFTLYINSPNISNASDFCRYSYSSYPRNIYVPINSITYTTFNNLSLDLNIIGI